MPNSTAVYATLEHAKRLHAHGGRTILEPVGGGYVELVCSGPCCRKGE